MTTQPTLKDSEFQNPDGLTKEHVQAIVRHFGRLAKLDEAAAARTVRYVVDGTDEEVLLTVGGMKEAGKVLSLSGIHQHKDDYGEAHAARKERARVLQPGSGAPPALWLRIGRIFAAALHAAGHPVKAPPGWSDWLAAFIVEIHQAWGG